MSLICFNMLSVIFQSSKVFCFHMTIVRQSQKPAVASSWLHYTASLINLSIRASLDFSMQGMVQMEKLDYIVCFKWSNCLKLTEALTSPFPPSVMADIRHEWCHFMNACIFGEVCSWRSEDADVWDSLSSCRKRRKPQKGSDASAVIVLMIHKSCWKKHPDNFIITVGLALNSVNLFFFFNQKIPHMFVWNMLCNIAGIS